MSTINTTLTTSGNSVAVRLPKNILKMSGLGNRVKLEAKKDRIIISRADNPREGWTDQIKSLASKNDDPTKEFQDLDKAKNDELHDLPWDGPSFEEWQKNNARLS
ncbi:MAG: AbrB/MazE/SpoVT family DNA-binding domain-containing protein [Candidatus Saccharimonadales bacterium]